MSLEYGPLKFQKLSIGSKVVDLNVDRQQPILIVSTNDSKLQTIYLRDLDIKGVKTNPLLMKSFHLDCNSQHFGLSGKNIVHCEDISLKINNRHDIIHKGNINHLITDQHHIAVTTSADTIYINSIQNARKQGEIHNQAREITSVLWNNSLIMSGDEAGKVNLWDINKQAIIHSNSSHSTRIDFLRAYVDFIHTNLYYSVSNKQRKANFYDIRTSKLIKTVTHLPQEIIDIQNNSIGKIFIATGKELQLIDLYHGFSPLGKFCLTNEQKDENRSLKKMLLWDKYVIAGTDSGCIEVYDSDLLKCLYSYGVCQFSGVKEIKRINNSLIVLQQKGLVTAAKLM